MNGLDTRELRYFVAVAEELHFGRAAERLHVAQPAVSRTIRGLEARLRVRLLDRTTRRVALTDAGTTLLERARPALDALAAAERLTVQTARRQLVVALKPDGDAGLLPEILAAYEREEGTPPVELRLLRAEELVPALRSGAADVALVATPFDQNGLHTETVLHEPRVLALPANHPLAATGNLRLPDIPTHLLARWDGVPPQLDAYYRAELPADGPFVRDLPDALRLIELGHAALLLPRSVADRYRDRAIAYRPVDGLSPSRLVAVWRDDSTAVRAFVRAARAR